MENVILFLLSTTKILLKKSSNSVAWSLSLSFFVRVAVKLKEGFEHLLCIYAFISWPILIIINTFERILGKQHKIKQDTQCPNINRNSIISVAYDLRRHIFLSSTVSLGTNSSNGPGESKISNFITKLTSLLL